MERNKIMFYINTLGKGGAERVISQLAYHFHCAGYDSVLVTSFQRNDEYALGAGVRRILLEDKEIKQSKFKRNLTRIKKLRQVCKEEKPQILISFMQEPNFRSIIATLGLPTKTIISVRNDPNREYAGRMGKLIGKCLLPMADGCVFQTEEAKAWFPMRLQKKSTIIMNEVAERFFDITRREPKNVVTVGRLREQKNQKMLLKAFATIAPNFPEEKLLIYGEGNCRESLEKQIVELGLNDRAFLMGNTDCVENVLAEAAVFVLPSDYEGMPNALMEALAVGVPSISTDCPCGGPRALIENGKNGVLVPVNGEEALAEAMTQLLGNPSFAKSLGDAARECAYRYAPSAIFNQWKSYVDKVNAQRR